MQLGHVGVYSRGSERHYGLLYAVAEPVIHAMQRRRRVEVIQIDGCKLVSVDPATVSLNLQQAPLNGA
jgi:hypothetical protein